MRQLILGLASFLALSPCVSAQEPQTRAEALRLAREKKAQALKPHAPNKLEKYLVALESDRILERLFQGTPRGFFPFVGTLGLGSQVAFGPGYRARGLFGNQLDVQASSALSLKRYWLTEALATMPRLADRRGFAEAYFRKRDFPQVDFFGLGPDSRRGDRVNFTLRDTAIGLSGGLRVTPWLSVGSGVERLSPSIGRGRRKSVASIETLFAHVPGVREQTGFLHYRGFVDLNYREPRGNPRAGGQYQVSFGRYDDRDRGRYSFRHVEVDLQQYVSLFQQRRVLALHAMVAMTGTEPGQEVPFYLMPSLGNSRTLRGFRTLRFRDRHALLLQAEYRWELWSALDAALFVDAGKVVPRREDLSLKDLETDYGFGFRFGTANGVFLRIDTALGSRDGAHFRIRLSNVF